MWEGSGKTRNRRFVSRTDRYSLGVSSSTREQLVCEHSQRKRSGVSASSTDELATVASVWRRSLRRRNRSSFSAARVSRCDDVMSRRPPRSEGEDPRIRRAPAGVSDSDVIASRTSSSSRDTATTISSAGNVASASRMASATSASPAPASTVSPGSSSARRSATSTACENARSSFASQSRTPWPTTGTTTLTMSSSCSWARRELPSSSTVLTTRTLRPPVAGSIVSWAPIVG